MLLLPSKLYSPRGLPRLVFRYADSQPSLRTSCFGIMQNGLPQQYSLIFNSVYRDNRLDRREEQAGWGAKWASAVVD